MLDALVCMGGHPVLTGDISSRTTCPGGQLVLGPRVQGGGGYLDLRDSWSDSVGTQRHFNPSAAVSLPCTSYTLTADHDLHIISCPDLNLPPLKNGVVYNYITLCNFGHTP